MTSLVDLQPTMNHLYDALSLASTTLNANINANIKSFNQSVDTHYSAFYAQSNQLLPYSGQWDDQAFLLASQIEQGGESGGENTLSEALNLMNQKEGLFIAAWMYLLP